jgi:hypothetical protein
MISNDFMTAYTVTFSLQEARKEFARTKISVPPWYCTELEFLNNLWGLGTE